MDKAAGRMQAAQDKLSAAISAKGDFMQKDSLGAAFAKVFQPMADGHGRAGETLRRTVAQTGEGLRRNGTEMRRSEERNASRVGAVNVSAPSGRTPGQGSSGSSTPSRIRDLGGSGTPAGPSSGQSSGSGSGGGRGGGGARTAPAPGADGDDNGTGTPATPPASRNVPLDNLRRPRRPNLRLRSRYSVFRDAQRAPNGEDFICPNSRREIPCERDADGNAILYNERGRTPGTDETGFTRPAPNPSSNSGNPQNYHFGHVEESEFRRLVSLVEDNPGTFNWKEVLNEYNRPEHYQIEDPSTNEGHGSESDAPGYGHYQEMLDKKKAEEEARAAEENGENRPDNPPPDSDGRTPRTRR
jgi:hypothetical protein